MDCFQPFGENTITLDCGHTFDKTCLTEYLYDKDECVCPICLVPYDCSLLIPCLLCNKPFGEKTTTLGCGHKFDSVCLRQDLYNKDENLDECVCPVCLEPYNYTILIFENLPPNPEIQRARISKINEFVIEKAHKLDKKYKRKNIKNPSRPTKESMDEAKLMGKQNIKQKEQRQKEKQEELILQQKAVIQHQEQKNQQKEELILQLKAVIKQKEEQNEEQQELIVQQNTVIKQKEEQNEEQQELIVQQNAIIKQLSRPPQPPNRRVF